MISLESFPKVKPKHLLILDSNILFGIYVKKNNKKMLNFPYLDKKEKEKKKKCYR